MVIIVTLLIEALYHSFLWPIAQLVEIQTTQVNISISLNTPAEMSADPELRVI